MTDNCLTMKYRVVNFVIFFLMLTVIPGLAQRTNLGVVDSLLAEIVDQEVIASRDSQQEWAIKTDLLNAPEANYLQSRLSMSLARSGMNVTRNFDGEAAFETAVIEPETFTVVIVYGQAFRESMFSEAQCSRRGIVQFKGQIFSAKNGNVEKNFRSELSAEDVIPWNTISDLEVSPFGFTTGRRMGAPAWEEFFEPGLVLTSVAILVYLFFTQRG
jgi:hypothetical protein